MATQEEFEPVIGLEVHAQLSTNSKIFCGCKASYGEPPNSLTCPVCLGLPGALPVLNKQAVEFAMRMVLAVGGTIQKRSAFARKNYFYPDLPKGYQISQYDRPLGEGGEIRYRLQDGEERVCRLIRIHIEEDAGKSLHPEHGENFTRVDFNRCGTPLLEIVSGAEMQSPEEAYNYLISLKQILQYLDICSGDMEKGQLRCDANVSVRPVGQKEFSTRTEVKNMNSFKGVQRALRFEIDRQVKLLKSGEEVQQATLLWDEKRQAAQVMRSKEESHDYRYFPEPDLVNLVISDDWIERTRQCLPEMPVARATRFVNQYGIREYDAEVLTDSKSLADYFEEVMAHFDDGQVAANWIQTELLGFLRESGQDINECPFKPQQLADLLARVTSGELSGKIAKSVFADMARTGQDAAVIIRERGLTQISDESMLLAIVEKVLSANQKNVEQYRAGKTGLLNSFIGQVMKATDGQANPHLVSQLLKRKLEE